MIIRYATVILGAAILAGSGAFLASAVDPEKAGAATTTVRTCAGGTIQLKWKEKRTLRLHNHKRTSRGLRPLCVHPKLTKAARSHSASMIKKDYFGHGSVGRRLKRHGYNWRVYGENIAGGTGRSARPANIFRRWMGSRAHRANILDRRFGQVGVGTYKGTYKGHKRYTMYTVDFGRRR
jgi:uncharacterized protein YkwD